MYAEMFFTQTYWPDFNESELDDILSDFWKTRENLEDGFILVFVLVHF